MLLESPALSGRNMLVGDDLIAAEDQSPADLDRKVYSFLAKPVLNVGTGLEGLI